MFSTYLPCCYNINITVIVLIRKKRQANKLMCTCVEQLAEVYYILSWKILTKLFLLCFLLCMYQMTIQL